MSGTHRMLAGLVALGVAVATLTGCSTSSPQENVSQACTAARAHASALTSFKAMLKPDVPIEQVRSARNEVVKTYDELVKATQDVARDQVEAVKTAQKKFASAVDAVPDQATLPQAVDSLRDEAVNVQAAVSDLTTEIKC